MSKRINIPVVIRDGMSSVKMILTGYEKSMAIGYKLTKTGMYVKVSYPKVSKIEVNPGLFNLLELYAKIVSMEKSIVMFGMRQRMEDFDGAILRVVNYTPGRKIDDDNYILQTGRGDGATLSFVRSDLEFIYPTIFSYEKDVDKIVPNEKVVAIKTDECKIFSKGDIFVVKEVLPAEAAFGETTLVLKKDSGEFIAYAKYFKKSK